MLMITNLVLIACAAFALGLMAFSVGVWLTIWCGEQSGAEATAGKLAGYFVIVLAIVGLIVTSYHGARIIFNSDMMMPMMKDSRDGGKMDRRMRGHRQDMNKSMDETEKR